MIITCKILYVIIVIYLSFVKIELLFFLVFEYVLKLYKDLELYINKNNGKPK